MTDKQMMAFLNMVKKIAVKRETKEEIVKEIEDIIDEAKNTSKGSD